MMAQFEKTEIKHKSEMGSDDLPVLVICGT